ncbi:MAG: exopolysaccharide biosynthesis polyprenyl glycosylphosphotransferase [Acidobacteriia bacterium]|nr:exopolysaccharide biosynthesis polyprenyl glycosylphosphotransferase [Terriglobia bacterium]
MGAQVAFTGLAIRPARITQPAIVARARPRTTACVLLAADILAIFIAHALALSSWRWFHPSIGRLNFLGFWESLGLFALTYAALGLYSGGGLGAVEELRRSVMGTGFVCLLLTASLFFLQHAGPYSRGLLVLSGCLTAGAVPLVRSATRNAFVSRPWWGVPVIVLGAGKAARILIERLRKQPQLGFKPVACFDDDERNQGDCAGIPVYGWLPGAGLLAKTLGIRHALVALPEIPREDLAWTLDEWGATFRHVILIPDLFGVASLWASARDMGGVLGLGMRQNLLVPLNRWTKRAIDITGAVVLGILALPVLAAAAVWIKCASQGSVLYCQEREGEKGRPIRVPKLRTMHPDAEALLTRVLSESSETRAEWSCRFKLRKDPRILPGVGRWLRRTSLDELPQLWSVIKGEMSLVGPRPFPSYHLNTFGERFQTLRGRVKPGLTGLWQVSDRADGDLQVQETLDTFYIRNWSLWLDLYILARTVRAVLFPKGAY